MYGDVIPPTPSTEKYRFPKVQLIPEIIEREPKKFDESSKDLAPREKIDLTQSPIDVRDVPIDETNS
jgi:hypothetical protein